MGDTSAVASGATRAPAEIHASKSFPGGGSSTVRGYSNTVPGYQGPPGGVEPLTDTSCACNTAAEALNMAKTQPRAKATHRTPRPRSGSNKLAGSLDRQAAGVDPTAKAANLLQMKRARGQVEGIERMIDQDRYCADIIFQITAARASLQTVARDLLARHLKACHTAAISNGGAAADEMYQELVDLVSKMAK
jgi:DNA-binding FrmR family transcriptional regulator